MTGLAAVREALVIRVKAKNLKDIVVMDAIATVDVAIEAMAKKEAVAGEAEVAAWAAEAEIAAWAAEAEVAA